MNRIDTLQINNFKFFQNQTPIKLGGNHLLAYGENGSGKSSIYWALYTLFESSLKPNDNQIKKYFTKKVIPADTLVNIHALEVDPNSDNWNSFIEIITDDTIPEKYKVSHSDVAIRKNEQAQLINYASDFINYRMLLSLSSFRHRHEIDLSDMFIEDVFKYVRFNINSYERAGFAPELTNALEIWEQIELGPDELDSIEPINTTEINKFKQTPPYVDFEKFVNQFNKDFDDLIAYINLHGSEYLKKLGYDFKYVLTHEYIDFNIGGAEYDLTNFKVKLKIPEYETKKDAIAKPHSFLNEAKLSAIAISIRIAILKKKIQENTLKFIVLDDLLISLDMCNREKVLEVFLSEEFSKNYQLIVFTHDLQFFNLCKRKIQEIKQDNWVYYEIYADETNHKPAILESESYFAKGCNHFHNFDYPAAGNYFRKTTEDVFETLFPREVTIAESGEKRTTLKGYLDAAIKLYERIGLSTTLLRDLDNYLFLLLNPLSHRAVDSNVYKIELNRVKTIIPQIIEEVKNFNFRELVAANNTLVVHFIVDPTKTHEYFINTCEPIYIYSKDGKNYLSNSRCKSYESSTIINGGRPDIVKNEHFENNNIVSIHRNIYEYKKKQYDDSFMANIYHQEYVSLTRKSLNQIFQTL
jgi:hypothetical protein